MTTQQGCTRRRRHRGDEGITLAELMVTVGVLALVATMLATQFEGWVKTATTTQDRSEAMAEGRLAMDRMSRSIRQAMPASPGEPVIAEAGPWAITILELTTTAREAGSLKRVRYAAEPGDKIQETRELSASTTTLAQYVANQSVTPQVPLFRFYSDPYTEIQGSIEQRELSAAERQEVAIVKVTLMMDKDPRNPTARTRFESSIYVRSKGF